ncbi:putative transcription factor interactor and regulator CCHC(Zn) family [Helianthus annuus]|nr:putative transcription factor interactor and regulator CCHC(Zn) family [Helianthus annuus]KAJ0606417.1 putative transcription factor interactor and regulator CCHC(Zn) family [Helianthus annuus]
MKIGFDKAKVTCFKCKQKGHFKRECTNNKADDNVNPFQEDYYKKAIYHRNNEQPSRKHTEEGSSKEKKQAMLMIRDGSSGPSTFHHDEGFNWGKYIKDDRTEKWVLIAEFKESREERHARMYLSEADKAFTKARHANRWSQEKECSVDPKGNQTVDPDKVDFKAIVAANPTVGVWCKGLEEIPRYREKVEEGIRKVIYAGLEKKKKTVEEIVDESQKLVDEVKKADEKDEKVVAEKQQVVEE